MDNDCYFYSQQSSRPNVPKKRARKLPDDLPTDLKHSLLSPRLAAYLIKKQAALATLSHDTLQDVDWWEDSQRRKYKERLTSASDLLTRLAQYLYEWTEERQPAISKGLEKDLRRRYIDLILTAIYYRRDWQCIVNRHEYQRRIIKNRHSAEETVIRAGRINKLSDKENRQEDRLTRPEKAQLHNQSVVDKVFVTDRGSVSRGSGVITRGGASDGEDQGGGGGYVDGGKEFHHRAGGGSTFRAGSLVRARTRSRTSSIRSMSKSKRLQVSVQYSF